MIAIATIDELVEAVPSKYTLVHLAARRAREINDYFHTLGEGLRQYVPPLVDDVASNKPLTIALEEIAQGKIVPEWPGDARRAAEALLSSGASEEELAEALLGPPAEGEAGDGEVVDLGADDAEEGDDAEASEEEE